MLEKMLTKQFAPLLVPKAQELEQQLLNYLENIPLQDGETHATAVVDIDTDTAGKKSIVFVVATFKVGTFCREIMRIPVIEFVQKLNFSEILKQHEPI